jgi:hypothetical protein
LGASFLVLFLVEFYLLSFWFPQDIEEDIWHSRSTDRATDAPPHKPITVDPKIFARY